MNNPLTHFWSPVSVTVRGSQDTSPLTFSSAMLHLCYFALTLLCSVSLLCPVLSLHCNDTQYAWPVDAPTLCCSKCPPGKHLAPRHSSTCTAGCKSCKGDRFIDKWNEEMNCEICKNCNRENMEYQSRCSPTQNAVCRCKAGYECRDQSCKQCVAIKTTTKAPLPPSTTALKPAAFTTVWQPHPPIRDTVWFLVIIALLCAGLAVVIVTKIKPFLRWIESKQGYFLAKEAAPVQTYSEDEDMPTPVQEVREKCDQCEV